MTTTTRYPVRTDVNECFDRYRDAMRPFIMQAMKAMRGATPEEHITAALKEQQRKFFQDAINGGKPAEDAIDETTFPNIVSTHWNATFATRIRDHKSRNNFQSWLFELRGYRNDSKHPPSRDIDPEQGVKFVDVISSVLQAIGAESVNEDVKAFREKISSSTAPAESHQTNATPKEAAAVETSEKPAPTGNKAKPWREVIKPQEDVIYGNLQTADFAADLQAVYDGKAEDNMYGNPLTFFRQTYMTKGIKDLISNTLKRLTGNGGYPVIQAKTGFGGGKTHSLIALYHIVSNSSAIANADWDERDREAREHINVIMRNAGISSDENINAKISVLNGINLSPTDTDTTKDGDPLNTLWGVMAYQLGGQPAYNIIGNAAKEGTAPGGRQLRQLFESVGPCVILMDEIVNYARNINATRLDNVYTFFQNLTETVKHTDRVAVVISLPETERETGSEEAAKIQDRLETILGRVETVWRPVDDQEGFEVVRRQLFRDETCDKDARDLTCQIHFDAYRRKNNRSKFPSEASKDEYLERMKQCYPIHPEVFDRLYNDWSTLEEFQRTRGVLRLMAIAVNLLYNADDNDPLITSGSLPINKTELGNEFARLLPSNWNPVLNEVDKEKERTDEIDAGNAAFRDHGIAKRIARAIFLGSPPHQPSPGLRDLNTTLGAYVIGTPLGNYDRALKTMGDRLYHLYREQGRHRFSSDINFTRVINDRKSQITAEEREEELIRKIREHCDHPNAIACPDDSAEVPDTEELKVVLLKPSETYHRIPRTNKATPAAAEITSTCGETKRAHVNTVLTMAITTDYQRQLDDCIRQLIARRSILYGEKRVDHLSDQRRQEAVDGVKNAESDLQLTIDKAYSRIGLPMEMQSETHSIKWTEMSRRECTLTEKIENAMQDSAYVQQINPADILAIWQKYKGDENFSIANLWYILISDTEAPRPRNWEAVELAIRSGVSQSKFGYADGYDNEQVTYNVMSIGNQTLEDGYVTEGPPEDIEPTGVLVDSTTANEYLRKGVKVIASDIGTPEQEKDEGPIQGQADDISPESVTEEWETATTDDDAAKEQDAPVRNGEEHDSVIDTTATDARTVAATTPESEDTKPEQRDDQDQNQNPVRSIRIDFHPRNRSEHTMSQALANDWESILTNEGSEVQMQISIVHEVNTTVSKIPNYGAVTELTNRVASEPSNGESPGGYSQITVTFTVTATNHKGIEPKTADEIRDAANAQDFITVKEQD